MIRTLAFVLFTITLLSCGDKRQKDLVLLKDEVMAIHDEVMPKMGELRKVEKALRAASEGNPDSLMLVETADMIGQANESMMVWMRAYEPDFEGDSMDQTEQYFNEQKVAIQKVKNDMVNSLSKGNDLLKE